MSDLRPTLEQRLVHDEARLTRDEALLEAEEAEIQASRIIAWSGVVLAVVVAIAVADLVVSIVALRQDVSSLSQTAPEGSVSGSRRGP